MRELGGNARNRENNVVRSSREGAQHMNYVWPCGGKTSLGRIAESSN